MIDPATALGLVITTALKAASSEVVKHSIDALSDRLGNAIAKRDQSEAEKIVQEENLIEPLAKIAQAGLNSSVIIPLDESDTSSPKYKSELFLKILEMGFRVSAGNKMDILLPGSLINSDHVSVFSTKKNVPSISKTELEININSGVDSYYSVVPIESGQQAKIIQNYKDYVRDFRNETLDAYVNSLQIGKKDSWAYNVKKITAGSLYFEYSQNALALGFGAAQNRVKIKDFAGSKPSRGVASIALPYRSRARNLPP